MGEPELPFPQKPEPESPEDALAHLAEEVDATSASEQIKAYLADLPGIYPKYLQVRTRFVYVLTRFAKRAQGTNLEPHASRFAAESRSQLDTYFLKLFRIIGLHENPVLLSSVFADSNHVPDIRLADPEGDAKQIELGAVAWAKRDDNTIVVVDLDDAYGAFPEAIWHEFVHLWMGERSLGIWHGLLSEGITQLITEKLLEEKPEGVYEKWELIASALFDLDRDMLLTWYVSGDDQRFHARLRVLLEKYYSAQEAAETANAVLDFNRQVYEVVYSDDYQEGDLRKFVENLASKLRAAADTHD